MRTPRKVAEMRRPSIVVLAAAFVLLASAQIVAPRAASAQVHANSGDALDHDPFANDPDGAIDRARRSVAAGDLTAAIAGLTRYVSDHPAELAPARYLGDLYYREGEFARAERTYRDILRSAPKDVATHDRLGGVLAAEDRIGDAIAEFTRSLPEGAAYGSLVELHRRRGDLDRFEAESRSLADGDPTNENAQYAIGTIYDAEHRPELAVNYLERALLLDGTSCPTLTELGAAYTDLDRYDDAERVLRRCLARDADSYEATVDLGLVETSRKRFDNARSIFDRANRLRPTASEALVDLGYVADAQNDWRLAVSYYLRAITSNPLSRDAYVDLGSNYEEHGLYALAEAAYLKGLSVAPRDGRLHYLLGVTYADQGKRDLARTEYRAATASDEPEVASAAKADLTTL